eukprot:2395036-Rhodomonas_salina.1
MVHESPAALVASFNAIAAVSDHGRAHSIQVAPYPSMSMTESGPDTSEDSATSTFNLYVSVAAGSAL